MLYLHVGLHKTGTSSIQETFFVSRARLREHGLAYFDYAANHSQPLMWTFTANRLSNPATLAAGMSERDVLRKAAEVERALIAFMEDRSCASKLISGESLSTFQGRDVETIKAFLERFGHPIRVVLYLRNYFDYLNSQVQELMKWGWTLPALSEAIRDGRVIKPNYRRKIARFMRIFGRDAVDVRLFHRSCFVGGDLITDFCDALGVASARMELDVRTLNASLSGPGAQLVSDHNALSPTGIVPRPDPLRLDKLALFEATDAGSKFRITDRAMLADYRCAVAEDAAFVERLVGTEACRLLTVEPARGRVPSAASLMKAGYELALRSLDRLVLDLDGADAANEFLLTLVGGGEHEPRTSLAKALPRIKSDALCRRLARVLLQAGRSDLAKRATRRALELDGGNLENRILSAEIETFATKAEPRTGGKRAKSQIKSLAKSRRRSP